MHELSLIQALIETVKHSAAENDIAKVNTVRIVVGESYGALPEALDFAFQVLTKDTICEGAVLEIDKTPLVLKCGECGSEYQPDEINWKCPDCGAGGASTVSGRELYVDYYEGD
ncbi:hydrogenase nickel incorporation protein HypA/HybF [Desulfotomaculum arcticum]|uniref:Hydrogenase maturation factor HypA n=1 Tax=Desulfotruncus arcticus DSM 17038 TaxID=1121424 RepID=A0A1I2U0S5_9FIRM|nr:hydrogenase maturation nickel metallochaperone HypA [Desulfotruncus arcticus]SFG69227.1 hydrogenase nickel incorporation protein HypA/HybF [Desulfotomaculum arcticum] [Desulfotruncus arcticus DSM 17038]